jgi:hypothetical protein
MSDSLFGSLSRGLGGLLAPIVQVVEDPGWLPRLLAELGVPPDANNNALIDALSAVAELKERIEALGAQQTPSFESIAAVLDAAADAFDALRKLEQQGPLAALEGLGRELVDLLLMVFLESRVPVARPAAALLTLLEPADERAGNAPVVEGGRLVRDTYRLDRWHLDRLPALLKDPLAVLRAEYGNSMQTAADAHAMADKLFPRLLRLLRALGLTCRYGFDPDDAGVLGDAAPFLTHALIVYVDDPLYGAAAESGVVLSLSAAQQGDLGLVISPFGTIAVQGSAGPWKLVADLTAGIDVVAWGRHGMTLLASPGTVDVTGRVSATLASSSDQPAYVLGDPAGSRIEVGGAEIKVATSLSEAEQTLAISGDVSKSAIVIAPGDGDGFINSILPAEGLRAEFDLGLAWSNTRGLTLRGSAGLETTLPIGLSIGGVTLSTVYLVLQARDASVLAEVSASVGVSIGPVHAVVDRVGIAAAVTFPEAGGNVGVANLDFGFKPPNGVGLSIDEAAVTGGGFLYLDSDKGQYAGVVQLSIEGGINVTGLGLIATRLPEGAKGYSLLIIIAVEDFKPIPLGLGFNLTGIGGLLAINRTFAEEVLRSGLKNHTLDSVLFPQDPIRNAPQILSNLNKVFPPANDHHLFGPMAQIAWGTPALITADLAIVLEFGARLRLLILAQIVAILPKPENDLVHLQIDGVGVLDFDQGTAALDATLYDSRLLKKFAMTGDMAMRLNWEGSPNFALAIGGLHPAYNPPPAFPKLERIAINLTAGDNPRFRCEAYFGLTSNTVQFGAHAELYASAAGFSIQGETGFDVLIQLDPFHFLADFYAQMQLKRGSTNLFKVRVEGALEGPRPLHIKAKATFEIFWMDISIRVDRTLVEGEKPPPPEPIDVLPRLKEALGNPGNWVAQLPAGQRQMVTLRAKPGAPSDVLLHPLGVLTIKQSVVPLDMDISRFGQAAPAGARRFTISSVSLGSNGENQTAQPIKDFFAPAQFFEMSDDEKLSRPSFEPMEAGVRFVSDAIVFTTDTSDWLEAKAIEFETWILDKGTNVAESADEENAQGVKLFYQLSPTLLGKQASFGAAGNSELRRTGKAKYRTTIAKHRIAKEGWTIVKTDDLTVQPVAGVEAGKPASYSEAAQALRKMKQEAPAQAGRLKILRPSELARN